MGLLTVQDVAGSDFAGFEQGPDSSRDRADVVSEVPLQWGRSGTCPQAVGSRWWRSAELGVPGRAPCTSTNPPSVPRHRLQHDRRSTAHYAFGRPDPDPC